METLHVFRCLRAAYLFGKFRNSSSGSPGMRTPVITTQGTPWEELETRKCGWWTEIGEKAAADALENFLACTENELEEMGRNGRKLIEEKYSSRKMAEKMFVLYKSLSHI